MDEREVMSREYHWPGRSRHERAFSWERHAKAELPDNLRGLEGPDPAVLQVEIRASEVDLGARCTDDRRVLREAIGAFDEGACAGQKTRKVLRMGVVGVEVVDVEIREIRIEPGARRPAVPCIEPWLPREPGRRPDDM